MSRRQLIAGKVLIVLAMFLGAAPPAHCAIPKQVDVGVIIPMTGGWQTWGERIQNGLEIFADEHAGTIKFKFYYQDEATCDSGKALHAYNFLRNVHGIKIFVLGCMNGARAILPLAAKDSVLLLSAGFQEQKLFSLGGRLINLALQIGSEGQRLASIIEASGVKRLALLRAVGTEEFLNAMQEYFKVSGVVKIVYDQELEGSEKDMASLLLQVRSRGADGLFLNLPEPQLLEALRSKKNQHIDLLTFSSYGVEWLATTNAEMRALVYNLMFTRPYRGENEAFDESFRRRFSHQPLVNVYFVYDGLTILVDALHACTADDVDCLFNFFATDTARYGYGGEFKIRRDGSIERKFEVRRFRETITEVIPDNFSILGG